MTADVDLNTGRMIIMEGTKRATQADRKLSHFKMWSWDDFRRFVAHVYDPERQAYFMAVSRRAERLDIPTPGDYRVVHLEDELRKAIFQSFHRVDHEGGLTGLSSMIFEPESDYRTWRIYNPDILIANFETEGTFGYDTGIPGKGKTNNACVIGERWLGRTGHVLIGDIRIETGKTAPANYIYTEDAKAFFTAIASLPKGTPWMFLFDEGGLVYAKQDQPTRRAKDLDKLFRILRKLRGRVVYVDQMEDAVPRLIHAFATQKFYAEEKGVVSIELQGPDLAFSDTVRDFPKTSIPFDTYDWAYFDINVDIQKLLSATHGADEPMIALRRFLEMEDAPAVEYLAKVCAFPGCGKSLVGMHPNAKYCSNNVPPYHAQLDAASRRQRGLAKVDRPAPYPIYKDMDDFLKGKDETKEDAAKEEPLAD